MNRREILRAIALGGGVVAGEVWVPGARVISIPSDDVLSRFQWADLRGVFGRPSVEELAVEINDFGIAFARARPLRSTEFRARVAEMLNEAYDGVYLGSER